MYSALFSQKAAGEYKKLPIEIQGRIKKRLEEAQTNPFHYFERLKGRLDYKLRVGDYRVIADITSAMQRIEITKVGHRKNIYKQNQ